MIIARVLGYAVIVFFLLASTNALKRYTKDPLLRNIAKNHQIFGGIAVLLALVHLIVNVSYGNLDPLGLITLLLLISTGTMGALFKQLKNKKLYIAHRVLGPLTLVVALVHLFINLFS